MHDQINERTVDWQKRMAVIVQTMRDISLQTDPQAMVRIYGQRIRQLRPVDASVSMSRRGLTFPQYRITRSSTWRESINPWKEKDRLPLLEGGLLAELIYGDEPRILDDFTIAADDPAAGTFAGYRSLQAIPLYDQGVALNMVVLLRKEPAAFSREQFPEMVWLSNLFGRATNNLVLSAELQAAYTALDHELKVVADIQRSLLPAQLPRIPMLDLAAFYQPSRRAGGDYYDFFPLPDGKWGIFIADVSGHGTPAAVIMAITHCIATHPGPAFPRHGSEPYQQPLDHTVHAPVGNLRDGLLWHLRPGQEGIILCLCRTQSATARSTAETERWQFWMVPRGLPLGIFADQEYKECVQQLQSGDQMIFYTDGITKAHSPTGEMFGTARLDQVLELCTLQASALLDTVLKAVEQFTAGHPADDDRTAIVARVC